MVPKFTCTSVRELFILPQVQVCMVYMMVGERSFFYNYCNVETIIASVHCNCHSSKLYMVRWLVKEPFFKNVETISTSSS